ETAQRTEYRRGLDLTQETRAELERLRGRAARAGLPVLDERTGDFRHVRRESRPGRPPRGDAPPRSRRQRTQDGPPVPPPGDGEGPAPKRRRRRRRSRGSTTAAG